MENYRVALMQGYEIDEYAPFVHYVDPGKSMLTTVKTDVLCTDPFVYPVMDSFICAEAVARKNTDKTFDEDFKRCKDYTLEDCGKIRNSTIVPQGPCGEDIIDKQSCLEYGKTYPDILTIANEQRFIRKETGRCRASCISGVCSEIVETAPYTLINSGFCDHFITTVDECEAAARMIERGRDGGAKIFLGEMLIVAASSSFIKGCYMTSTNVYFNAFLGFSLIPASVEKTSICKINDLYLDSQALVRSLEQKNSTAIQYSERESRIFYEETSGDGFIMSDCLIFKKGVFRNQNRIYLDSGNYLIWDLGGESNAYGVEIKTSLNQISPNGRISLPTAEIRNTPHVRLHSNFKNPRIRVGVYGLSEDVTIEVSTISEWDFLKDVDFELKPERPPVLTIGGTCAGSYEAGAGKTPTDLLGDWVFGDYKLRKNQKTEFDLGTCVDKLRNQGAHCTLSVSKDACFAYLSEIQSCVEYNSDVCKVFCTSEGSGCCEGEQVTAAHASFVAPYVLVVNTPNPGQPKAAQLASFYTPDYECLLNQKPYVLIDNRLCNTAQPPIGRLINSKYDESDWWMHYGMEERSFEEAFELDPMHALSSTDKVEECARRCAIEGYEEFTIVNKRNEKRCLCNDDCVTNRNDTPLPSNWYDGTNTLVTYTFESYKIVDLFVAAYSDVEMSCEDNYVSVHAGLPEFDGFLFRTEYSSGEFIPVLYNVPDGYFKVFNNEVPTLMATKCVFQEVFNFNHVKTRFLKFSVDSDQFLTHAIEVRPILSTTEVLTSSEKSGCIEKNHVVNYYDFMPTVISSAPVDCKYKLLEVGKKCTNGVLQANSISTAECAALCGSAFHTEGLGGAKNCWCAPFGCGDRTVDSISKSYSIGGEDCSFELLAEGPYCVQYEPAVTFDLVACADYCFSLGFTAFDMQNGYDDVCACSTDNCETRQAGISWKSYRKRAVPSTEPNFIRISDKSCEHYGHRTIMNSDVCTRGAFEFGGFPGSIFESVRNGKCEDATVFTSVNDELDCSSLCEDFSIKRLDTFVESRRCSVLSMLYSFTATNAAQCENNCKHDLSCRFYKFRSNICRVWENCDRDESLGFHTVLIKNDVMQCGCSENCEIGSGEYLKSVGFQLTSASGPSTGLTNPSLLHSRIPVSGTDNVPRLVDIDSDGDLDLFMTSNNVATRYWKNIGTPSIPNFEEKFGNENPLDGVHCGVDGAVVAKPCYFTFGDIDKDGDIDVLYMEINPTYRHRFHNLFQNQGTAENPIFVLNRIRVIDVNDNDIANVNLFCDYSSYCNPKTSVPFLFDYNGDGNLDVLILKDRSPFDHVIKMRVFKWYGSDSTFPGKYSEQDIGYKARFETVSNYATSFADLDGDGRPEIYYKANYLVDDSSYSISDAFHLNGVLLDGEKAFGDLNGDGAVDVVVATTSTMLFYKNFGVGSAPNFHDPTWLSEGCDTFCSTPGFQVILQSEETGVCECTSDFTSSVDALPYMIYQPDSDVYHTYSKLPLKPRGCSMDYFTDKNIQVECTDCICVVGDSIIEADFVEVSLGTCISNGYSPIGLESECYSAVLELGYNPSISDIDYPYRIRSTGNLPLGCVYENNVPHIGNGAVECSDSQMCICKRQSLYEEVIGTCESHGLYFIKTWRECEAAGIELSKASAANFFSDGSFSGCSFSAGTLTFHSPPGLVFLAEGIAPSGSVICRKANYPSNDYVSITSGDEAVCADNGFYKITTQNQCERAILSMGLRVDGIHPLAAFGRDPYQIAPSGCTHWSVGFASVNTGAHAFPYCSPLWPCLCSRSPTPPSEKLVPFFPLRDIVEYVLKVDSKYVRSSSCESGFDVIGQRECEVSKLLFSTVEPDCSNLCKHISSECDATEICLCHSDIAITVFDSNASCAVCGGGEIFDVSSSFFNENGNTRGCIYSEETSCSTKEVGWTQYIRAYDFIGNESSYEISIFHGYCPNSIDIRGDYENMQISEIVNYCQRLCRKYEYFSVNRDSCKCTSSCDNPAGAEDYSTFNYVESIHPNVLGKDEFVEKWNNNDPNIACFKDVEHNEYTSCDWIRALKHFARGASYRVGDCHNLGPGTGEGVASQIPCSGHGFLSGGTCACDYSEQFEIKDTGIGLTFELPTLRQTPFRGKDCSVMCPGFDLWSMASVCSGHGRCESDGRCACDQGFVGYKCHLECEKSVKALTCSGHGICNIVERPLTSDLSTLRALSCSTEGEEMFLARDRVIEVSDGYYYMYKQSLDLVVEFYRTRVTTIVDFSTATENDFIVVQTRGTITETDNDPEITICQGATLVKTFVGSPLSIIDSNGNYVVHNWNETNQISVSVAAGTYTYFCPENSALTGAFIVEECPSFVIRNATIDDFYMKGTAFRQPFETNIDYPYMPCVDSISLKREEAKHPMLEYTTADVFMNCSLLPGMFGDAYTIICGQCVCESSSSSGHWTGYDCRTPALGFLGEDAKNSCPGMVNEIPCNGRGTCDWGSVDGLGNDIYSSSDCFCGDTSINANYTTAPRNHAGNLVFHALNSGIPLYKDTVDFFEGNETACPEGTTAVTETECLYDKTGNLVTLEARILTDEEYILSPNTCAGFAFGTSTESIERTSASGELVIEGTDQTFQCAAACFGHYRYKANGKIGGILMRESLSGTFEENVKSCGFLCLNKENPMQGSFDGVGLRGFSISSAGRCYCESYGAVLLDEDWRYFEYVIPYREVTGGLCLLNNDLVYSNVDTSVKTNPGQTPEERVQNCARECQAFQNSDGEAVGFSYLETNAVCYCETLNNDCTVANPALRRFNFEYSNTFRLTQNSECLCGLNGGSDCFSTLDLPGVKPSNFVIEEQTEVYEDFSCLRNNNYVCKAGQIILKNFISNCECKDGFTGPLCETPRMMCIFGGSELDGTSCECPHPEAQNPLGCCAYGSYWKQDRYSGFSALQEFVELADNIFYKNSLLAVCKPLSIDSYQNPGSSTDEAIRELRQHNYVATTKDHKIITSIPCSGETDVSLYKAVYKFTETTTAHIGPPLDIFADQTVAYFSTHNAKMRCLDHCTINFNTLADIPKGFTLKTIKVAADTSAYVGEENDLPYAFRCYCNKYQAYVDDGYETRPSFSKRFKLSDTVIPTYSLRHDNQYCKFKEINSPYKGGQILNIMKYLHGSPLGNACDADFASLYGHAPVGATFDIRDYRIIDSGLNPLLGLRLSPDDENYNPDPKQGCSERCARDGYDTFWIDSGFNAYPIGDPLFNDFEEVEICQCMYSEDLFVGSGNEWESNVANLIGAELCSIYSTQERLEAIMKTCYNAGFDTFLWKIGDDGYSLAHCFMEADCELDSKAGYKVMDISDPEIFVSDESIVGDVYDIVYPKGTDNLECMQTDYGIVRHVDVAGLNRVTSDNGISEEIGVPHSLVPKLINVKHVHASTIAGDVNVDFNMQQCIAFCTQKKEGNDRINSMIFKPAYKTIETVFADGLTNDMPLPRCWGPCTSTSDCENNLQCFPRENVPPTADYVTGLSGCVETDQANNQYGNTGTTTLTNADSMCAIDGDAFALSMECQCTEHDPDFVCDKYTLRTTNGYCEGGTSIGSTLSSTEALFNTDKTLECKQRCLALNSDVKAFYIKVSDQSCGCGLNNGDANYCKLIENSAYQAYDIGAPWGESCDKVDGYLLESETGIFTEPVAERHPNTLACNIESYLDYGTIMDTGTCECPLYDFELLYPDITNFINVGNAKFNPNYMMHQVHYPQMVILGAGVTEEECKEACNIYTDCVEVTFKNDGSCTGFVSSEFFYNNIGMQDWNFIKVSDRACRASDRTEISAAAPTIEECMMQFTTDSNTNAAFLWGTPRGYSTDYKCYKLGTSKKTDFAYVDNEMDPTMVTYDADGNHICADVGMQATADHVPATGTAYEKSKVVSSSATMDKVPTYLLVQEAGYYPDADYTRYRKVLSDTQEINRYCSVGEVLEYEKDKNHVHANPHYCMQECRKKIENDYILSRADIVNNRFKCYCAQEIYDNCILQERSEFKQYKVYKSSTAYSSSERLISPIDPQIGKTKQCKCQGYYISSGEAFSCPKNTFKNSQHCTAECVKCPKGKSSEMGSTKCEQCAAGQVASANGCEKCTPGKYATIMDTACRICASGTYAVDYGAGRCTACPAGYTDDDPDEGLACDICPPGKDTLGLTATLACSDCSKGSYSSENGLATCTLCPTGRKGSITGATTLVGCVECTRGQYQSEKGQIVCNSCPPGKANPYPARPLCTTCEKGQVQDSSGQNTCSECGPGYYADQTGETKCESCRAGRYSNLWRRTTECEPCIKGQYASGTANQYCPACGSGKYADLREMTECTDCPPARPSYSSLPAAMGESFCYGSMWGNYIRDSRKNSCDSYYCGTKYTSSTSEYMSLARDCAPSGTNQMIAKPGDGTIQRRQCWTGSVSGKTSTQRCNALAMNYGDNSESYSAYYAGGGWIWCRPTTQQQYSDSRL